MSLPREGEISTCLLAGNQYPLKGGVQKRDWGTSGEWRRNGHDGVAQDAGSPAREKDGVHAPRSRRAARAGVRAPIVARKRRNGRGAKVAQEEESAMDASQANDSAAVSPGTNLAEAVRGRWAWTAPEVWTDRMLTALEHSSRRMGCFPCHRPMPLAVSPWRGDSSTGEPDAGDPPVRFGGRGARNQSRVPTPIRRVLQECWDAAHLQPRLCGIQRPRRTLQPRAEWLSPARGILECCSRPDDRCRE